MNVALYKTLLTMPENQQLKPRTGDDQPYNQSVIHGGLGGPLLLSSTKFPVATEKGI